MTHPGYERKVVDGVVFRTSVEETNTIFGSASEPVWWVIYSSTWYNTDTGDQKFQVKHWLQMNILSSDVIEFEISFRPGRSPYALASNLIGEDSFSCELAHDVDGDPRFWKATVEEGYYQCTAASPDGTTGDYCDGSAYSNKDAFNENADAVSWATPYADDDEKDFWCTHAGSKDVWSPYECTAIKCPLWRDLDTLDITNDLAFAQVKAGVSDTMNIKVGRAMLYINQTTYATPAKGPLAETLNINVWNGAEGFLATALFLKAAFSMFF